MKIDTISKILAVTWWTAMTMSVASQFFAHGPIAGFASTVLVLSAYKFGHSTGKFNERDAQLKREILRLMAIQELASKSAGRET